MSPRGDVFYRRGGLIPLLSLRAKRSGLILKTRLLRRAFALLAMTDYRRLPHSQKTKANASNDEERHNDLRPSRHPERVSRSPEKSEGEGSPSFDKEWILQATPSE